MCNTVVRAELIGIYHALQENQKDNNIHILTDSLTAIQKILPLHSQPLPRSTHDHHHHVLHLINDLRGAAERPSACRGDNCGETTTFEGRVAD